MRHAELGPPWRMNVIGIDQPPWAAQPVEIEATYLELIIQSLVGIPICSHGAASCDPCVGQPPTPVWLHTRAICETQNAPVYTPTGRSLRYNMTLAQPRQK